jgi:predicted nucleotidyltransferase
MKEEVINEIERIIKNLGRKDVLAAGLFGSLARGDFNERSDIDIFIITKKELGIKEQDEFYYAFSELRQKI